MFSYLCYAKTIYYENEDNIVATIKDLAKRLGVSYSTVSKALNNDPKVSEKTRKRVSEEAEKIGFIFNENARGLVKRKTQRIGILLANQFNTKDYRWFFSQVQSFATQAIEEYGYDFFIQPHNNIHGESNIYRMIKGKTVDGIIIVSRTVTREEYDFLQDNEIPHVFCYYNPVFLDSLHPNLFMDDDRYGGYLATQRLLHSGHQQILTIKADDPAMKMYTARTEGYLKAMTEAGLSPEIIEIPMTFAAARQIVTQRFAYLKDFTAFFVQQDRVALSMIMELEKRFGYRLGSDYSIIGYNNMDLIEDLDIPLTTVDDPMENVIRNATTALMALIEKRSEDAVRVLYPTLVERNSVRENLGQAVS